MNLDKMASGQNSFNDVHSSFKKEQEDVLKEFREEFTRETANFVTYKELEQVKNKFKDLDKSYVKSEVF